jgi:hypothetical protein
MALLASSILSTATLASTISLDCTGPRMMAGGPVAAVSGSITPKKLSTGQSSAEGKLVISVRTPRKTIYADKVTVGGVYDNVGGTEYLNVGTKEEDGPAVYVNFTQPNLSTLEVNGASYPLECNQ